MSPTVFRHTAVGTVELLQPFCMVMNLSFVGFPGMSGH